MEFEMNEHAKQLLDIWLGKNLIACEEAAKYLGKKGDFNPKLEKPWPVWEKLRIDVDQAWYEYRKASEL